MWLYRLSVNTGDARSPLVLERALPDLNDTKMPEFRDAERSVLAQDIAELRIGYFGRDVDANDANEPTWRDRWADAQRLPLLIRIDVVPEARPADGPR